MTTKTPSHQTLSTFSGSSADDTTERPGGGSGDTGASDVSETGMLSILDESGRASRDAGFDAESLRAVHRAMVLTRKLDIRMLAMQRQGEMGTFAPGLGQEATQIGQVWPLQQSDWFSPSYRSFGAQLWRGWTIDGLMLLWFGFFEGFEIPEGVNDLPFSIVIGSHVLPAVGVAMGMRFKKDPSVMVVNFGDGAFSQGAIAEAMNFASVYKAPCVFVVENNGYAISTKAEHQAGITELAKRGPGFGIPSVRVDGNDILAMMQASKAAVEHARAGNGPYLVEAVTYRMSVHTTADDPKVYRDDAEVEAWEQRCPIKRFEIYLENKGILSREEMDRVAADCEQEVLEGREKFRTRVKANPREIFDYMFDEMPPELRRQQEEYFAKLTRKGVE
jgi:TPP-dependent pyruvate/acetoin dehydrogenase alpha subunit